MTDHGTSSSAPLRSAHVSRGRAVVSLLLVMGAMLAATAMPAGAARPWWWRTTTTTKAPTTTTTAAPPTSTTAPSTTTTAPTTTTTTTVPGDPCGGVSIPKATGGTWTCSFSDEFDGSALDRTKWLPQQTATSNYTSGAECFVDDPDNIAVAGGSLRLTVRKETAPMSCGKVSNTMYTGGMVSTHTKFSQAFGRFEFRAKFANVKVKGLQGAIWLWPDNPLKYGAWPYSGEIDVAEVYSLYADRAIPFLHYATYSTKVTNNYCLIDTTQFHTYLLEWTTTGIRISFDGKVCVDDPITPLSPLLSPQPFDHPFMVALTQGLGVTGNAFDPAVTPLPGTMEVDYVRVWK